MQYSEQDLACIVDVIQRYNNFISKNMRNGTNKLYLTR